MPESIADQLMQRRAALIVKANDIATRSDELSGEEQRQFDEIMVDAGKLFERAKLLHEGEQQARDLEDSFRKLKDLPVDETHRAGGDKSFTEWARSAQVGDKYEVRAMSASGGVGKKGVSDKLWEYAVASSQILQAGAEVINTADGNTLPLPRVTTHAGTPDAVVAASGPISSSDSVIDTVDLAVSKYAYHTLVPSELIDDVTFDLEGYISRNAGRDLGLRIAKQASAAAVAGFTTVGATGPTGTSTTLGTQSTAGQGTDLLIDLFHSVLPEYRTNAAFVMADPTAAIVRKLKASTGEPVWQPALTAGSPDMILGKAVYIDRFLPSPAANAKSIYFGDWSALKVRIAGGLRFERSNEYAFLNDQIAFRAIVRTGAVTIDPNAVKFLAHSAT